MTPNTPTPSATAPAGHAHTATPWHAVKHDDTQWAICYGGSDFACVAVTSQGNDEANAAHIVHCVNSYDQLLAQNAALLKRCEELTQEWRDLASTSNDRYHNCGDYERGYGDGIGFAKAYARRVLRDIADAALKLVTP